MALNFPGPPGSIESYIEDLTAGAYLTGLSEITITLWIKANNIDTDAGIITTGIPDGTDTQLNLRFDTSGASGGGDNLFKMSLDATGGSIQLESSSNVQTTEWQHIAMRWQSTEAISFFIEGIIDNPSYTSGTASGTINNIDFLRVGQGHKSSTEGPNWDGLISDFRIYDRYLSEEEILTISSTKGSDNIKDNLLLRLPLNDRSSGTSLTNGESVADISGHNRTFTTTTNLNTFRGDLIKNKLSLL